MGRGIEVRTLRALLLRSACRGLSVAAALTCALAVSGGAMGDTATIEASPALPWSDPAHGTPLELLASRIASHIAGRTVSVHCEGDTAWAALVSEQGGDPNGESGFVASTWNPATGQPIGVAEVAELSGGVCLALDRFAAAAAKPTKCLAAAGTQAGVRRQRAAQATSAGRGAGVAAKRQVRKAGACYLGGGRKAATMSAAFWGAYNDVAVGILTLAHESIHLRGVVGGRLSNGVQVGDPEAEAKADCYGMQWMPYVAVQFGDTADDAQAIATYFWDEVYPRSRGTVDAQYWSAECRPGGALDARIAGTTSWP